MRRFVSTAGLSKEEWLKYRKMGITGTDAGAICGLNPYVSAFQVYQDKITEETENQDNESMRQGRDLEEYVAQRFMEETGFRVRKANAIFQNEEHSIMLADFDRLIVGQNAGLECKTVSPYSADKWSDGAVPVHYQMQVQHYLATSGYDCWYIAALIFGNWRILPTLGACLLFGFARSGGYRLVQVLQMPSSYQDLVMILPYVLTLLLLVFFSKQNGAPRALGVIYDKGAR